MYRVDISGTSNQHVKNGGNHRLGPGKAAIKFPAIKHLQIFSNKFLDDSLKFVAKFSHVKGGYFRGHHFQLKKLRVRLDMIRGYSSEKEIPSW